MAETKQPGLDSIAVLVLALVGIGIVIYATPYGIGSSPDSVIYLVGARNLAHGAGFGLPSIHGDMIPITHRAPFYSFLLAIGERLGLQAMEWARVLNSLLFAGNILLIVQIARSVAAKHPDEFSAGDHPFFSGAFARSLWNILAAGLMLSALFLVEIHTMAWTEALFIFLFLIGVLVLGKYLQKPTIWFLLISSLATAFALLTRYTGIAIAAAFGLAILLFSSQNSRKRIWHTLLFGLVSAAPLALWMLRNSQVAGTATNREFIFHPIEWSQIAQALTTISLWLQVRMDSPLLVKILVIAAFSLIILYLLYFKLKQGEPGAPQLKWFALPGIILALLIFIPIYFIFLSFSLSFFDANTPLDGRILSPIFVSVLIVVVYLFQQIPLSGRRPQLALSGSWILALLMIVANSRQSISYIQATHLNGIGFDSPRSARIRAFFISGRFPPQSGSILKFA